MLSFSELNYQSFCRFFTSPKLAELTEVKTNSDLANGMINDAVARVVSRFAGMR